MIGYISDRLTILTVDRFPNDKELIAFYLKRLAVWLDDHPDQELVSYVHMVDGQYKHEVEIRQKKIGEFCK